MPRQSQNKVINGHEWTVEPWDAMHGLKMQARLAPVVKAAFAGGGDLMDMDVEQVLVGVFDQIDDEKTPKLIRDMLHGARVDGQDISMDRPFNELFAANYAELYQGLWFILQVNLGDLFTLGASIGVPEESEPKAEDSPENSATKS